MARIRCTQCGEVVELRKFCGLCGAALPHRDDPAAEVFPDPPMAEIPPEDTRDPEPDPVPPRPLSRGVKIALAAAAALLLLGGGALLYGSVTRGAMEAFVLRQLRVPTEAVMDDLARGLARLGCPGADIRLDILPATPQNLARLPAATQASPVKGTHVLRLKISCGGLGRLWEPGEVFKAEVLPEAYQGKTFFWDVPRRQLVEDTGATP